MSALCTTQTRKTHQPVTYKFSKHDPNYVKFILITIFVYLVLDLYIYSVGMGEIPKPINR